jgi:hypothetical protein
MSSMHCSERREIRRLINTQVIYPPTDAMAEALLSSSSTNLAERASRVDSTDLYPGVHLYKSST